jgi:hypothetical protein
LGDVEPAAVEIQRQEKPLIEAAPSLPVPAPPPPTAAAPPATAAVQPAKADEKSNNQPKTRGLSLAIRAGVALFGVVLIFLVVLYLRSVVSIFGSTPGPSSAPRVQTPDSATPAASPVIPGLGVDIYPGATPLSSEDHSTLMDRSIVSQTFVSSDTMAPVIDFYKKRMVGKTSIFASGESVVVSISPTAQDSILVTISPAQSGGKTRIYISHSSIMR